MEHIYSVLINIQNTSELNGPIRFRKWYDKVQKISNVNVLVLLNSV